MISRQKQYGIGVHHRWYCSSFSIGRNPVTSTLSIVQWFQDVHSWDLPSLDITADVSIFYSCDGCMEVRGVNQKSSVSSGGMLTYWASDSFLFVMRTLGHRCGLGSLLISVKWLHVRVDMVLSGHVYAVTVSLSYPLVPADTSVLYNVRD